MNRGNNQQTVFFDADDYQKYLELVEESIQQFSVIVYAYALLRTHLHLLLETPLANISQFMRSLNIRYVQEYRKRHRLIGHLFQGRFKSIIVDKDSYLLEVSRYIHLNPVRAGLVKKPEEYHWSSYKSYLGWGKDISINTKTILSCFSQDEERSRQKYQNFVNAVLVSENKIELPPVYGGAFYGTKDFVQKILKKVERRSKDKGNRQRREYDLSRIRTRNFQEGMYLLRKYTSLSLGEIAEKFGFRDRSAVRKVIVRLGMRNERMIRVLVKN